MTAGALRRLVLIHPNYHSGGAEIVGNWPPAWVAYLAGPLKAAGYTDIHFIDAMTHHINEEELRARITALQPDIVGCTAITPAIYRAERVLEIAREAGLVHVSLGTEAAAQMKLDLFKKETRVEENKEVIRLLREADIFTEAQFIVGLDNETEETLEETYRFARDGNPDLANWTMYTPWPFTPLFQELRDKVEVFDFEKYNFVTPIMKPAAMDRATLLDRMMHNYRRFYMNKALLHYHFDETRGIADAQMADWDAMADRKRRAQERKASVREQIKAKKADLAAAQAEARAVARDAGARTGDYIMRHRIPVPAQLVLRALPARLAAPLLLRAMATHAWTFAGSGEVSIAPARLTIRANPLAVPGCAWHCAVFEALFRRLVSARSTVREVSCCARGASACAFVIETG
ncbi:MAG: bacteriochlorophyll 4-vinyl reductase [Roseovarius sp.]|nr:bacteriochlorophyll 4-vinyl reductase [Roseovarius sp.]